MLGRVRRSELGAHLYSLEPAKVVHTDLGGFSMDETRLWRCPVRIPSSTISDSMSLQLNSLDLTTRGRKF